MNRLQLTIVVSFLCAALCVAPFAGAQDANQFAQGFYAYQNYSTTNIDVIDPATGALMIHVPLVSYKQKGSLPPISIYLRSNSYNWYANATYQNNDGIQNYDWELAGYPGVSVEVSPSAQTNYSTILWGYDQNNNPQYFTESYVEDDSGSVHDMDPFSPNAAPPPNTIASFSQAAADGSGFQYLAFQSGGSVFTDGSGLKYLSGQTPGESGSFFGAIADPNGNTMPGGFDVGGNNGQYSYTYGGTIVGTDSVGRIFQSNATAVAPTSAGCYPMNLPGANGGTLTFTLCYTNESVVSPYTSNEWYTQYSATIPLLTQVILPPNSQGQSTSYTFTYDGAGDVQSVTLPTGGIVTYSWPAVGSIANFDVQPTVSSRSVNANDGSGAKVWTYGSQKNCGSDWQVSVVDTDPDGNDTAHTFTAWNEEPETRYYSGSCPGAQPIKTVNRAYQLAGVLYFPTGIPTSTTTTWPSGKVDQVTYTYDNADGYQLESDGGSGYQGQYGYTLGQVVEKDEYDYGQGGPGPLLRTTDTSYVWQSNSSYFEAGILNTPQTTTVYDGSHSQVAQTTQGYDDPSRSPGCVCGNNTSTSRWLATGTSPVTYTSFNSNGMPTSTTDGNGNTATISYDSTGAYPQQITHPPTGNASHIESYTYEPVTGLLTSSADQNNQKTTYGYDFNTRRLTSVTYPPNPGGGQISYSYNDASLNSYFTFVKTITSGTSFTEEGIVDGLGRQVRTELQSDPDGVDFTDTTYDDLGRVYTVSNPYRSTSDSTYGITTYKYDALGRPTTTIDQDSNTMTIDYSNFPCVKITDEALRSRALCADGLGRTTSVTEDPGGLNYSTTYNYDGLDNLINVTQSGSRQRTFSYDSLSRLVCAANPEVQIASCPYPFTGNYTPGTIGYGYDANGNVISKTSPAPNQTNAATTITLTYCYDALNRLTAKAYSQQSCSNQAVPPFTATYGYDQAGCQGAASCYNIGQRTSMVDQAGSEAWAYDPMGRAIVDLRTTNGLSKTISYTYNLDESLATETTPTWPDGSHTDVQTYTPGGAGRPIAYLDQSWAVADPIHYTPAGQVCYRFGVWGSNYYTSMTYNNRLQLATFGAVSGFAPGDPNPNAPPSPCSVVNYANYGTNNWDTNDLNLTYSYVDSNGHNNGNVISITNEPDWYRSQSFAYDSLNRLASAETYGVASNSPQNCWGENYSFDAWGNLLQIAQMTGNYTGCYSEQFDPPNGVTAQNQLSSADGYNYDAAGNLIQITGSGAATYTYDAENHLISTAGVNYTYDGDGKRVMKSGGGTGTIYWYGVNPEPLMETDLSNNMFYVYMYLNGERLTRRGPNNEIDHYMNDAVGSARFLGDVDATHYSDYFPFGGEKSVSEELHGCDFGCTSVDTNYKFTGKERDSESNLDNFGARFYSSQRGRFMSIDPANAGADPTFPQSWNMYSYAANSPLTFTDPTGLYCYTGSTASDSSDWNDNSNYDFTIDEYQCRDRGGNWIPFNNASGTSATVYGSSPDYSVAVIVPGTLQPPNTGASPQNNPQNQPPQSPSWWGTFAKNFFGNFVSLDFYKSEFSSNGCLNTFASASLDALNPASPSLASAGGAGTMAVAAQMRYNAAQAYAASRTNVLGGKGLIFPQNSIPYNNILEGSAVSNLAEGGLGYVDGAMAQGLLTEYESAMNGTCH